MPYAHKQWMIHLPIYVFQRRAYRPPSSPSAYESEREEAVFSPRLDPFFGEMDLGSIFVCNFC